MRHCLILFSLIAFLFLSACHLVPIENSSESAKTISPSNEVSSSSNKETLLPATFNPTNSPIPSNTTTQDIQHESNDIADTSEATPITTPTDNGLKSTAESPDIFDSLPATPVSMDFNGDGTDETLTIDVTDDFEYEDDGMTNKPTQITLTIGSSQVIYESTWNDGIAIRLTDLNIDDPYLDIIIEEHGTDIATNFSIYRYNGEQLSEYLGFHVEYVSFNYDSKGMIYFYTFIENNDRLRSVYVTLNYSTKEETYEDVDYPY